mmetsp:Transcript_9407/g.26578  ORF Transcript_9407/g.26578 Transcript_9407/m.26578 type:complete len:201 (-) Transcript_9407:15-617(-)
MRTAPSRTLSSASGRQELCSSLLQGGGTHTTTRPTNRPGSSQCRTPGCTRTCAHWTFNSPPPQQRTEEEEPPSPSRERARAYWLDFCGPRLGWPSRLAEAGGSRSGQPLPQPAHPSPAQTFCTHPSPNWVKAPHLHIDLMPPHGFAGSPHTPLCPCRCRGDPATRQRLEGGCAPDPVAALASHNPGTSLLPGKLWPAADC